MSKKICRIITDNKIGNINPALALAEAVQQIYPSLEIELLTLKYPKILKFIPYPIFFLLPLAIILKSLFNIMPNSEAVLTIGNGSNSIIPCLLLRKLERKLGYQNLFVQLQNPRINPKFFDYVIAPTHDFIRGENVIPTIGSLSRVHHMLAYSNIKLSNEFLELPKPVIAVFIGGSNSRHTLDAQEAEKLANKILSFSIAHQSSLAITCSRRTGIQNETIIRNIVKGKNIFFPDQSSDNPYYMMLKHCESAIVTCDSINMISDCVTAGLPTYVYYLPGDHGKFNFFYNSLKRRQLITPFNEETLSLPERNTFDEARRVAKIISQALLKKTKIDNH